MKQEELLVELEALTPQLGVTIRYEKGDFEGGYCILRDARILLVNKRLMPRRRASVLAVALHEIGLDNLFIKPVVREYIEDEVARTLRAARP
ncbi:MAG: hypothetical protein HW407_352 [Bacteroidetes bacterium]|nr:hypothetical protein [Bacteroidota bacterium]